MKVPPEYAPDPAQIPSWATDLHRFRLCFAITRAICERDDPLFLRELYYGDVPTDDLDGGEDPDVAVSA